MNQNDVDRARREALQRVEESRNYGPGEIAYLLGALLVRAESSSDPRLRAYAETMSERFNRR